MGRAGVVSRVEASADLPLSSDAVWDAILDGTRWPDWMASTDSLTRSWRAPTVLLRLEAVTRFTRPSGYIPTADCAVGDIRQETARIARPLGLGMRTLAWRSVVTDVDHGRSLEIEAPQIGPSLRDWRLRLNIQPTGVQPLPSWFRLAPPRSADAWEQNNLRAGTAGTRLQVILTYRPNGLVARLYDRLTLRALVHARVGAWLAGLTRSLTVLADLESRAQQETIRYLPEPIRSTLRSDSDAARRIAAMGAKVVISPETVASAAPSTDPTQGVARVTATRTAVAPTVADVRASARPITATRRLPVSSTAEMRAPLRATEPMAPVGPTALDTLPEATDALPVSSDAPTLEAIARVETSAAPEALPAEETRDLPDNAGASLPIPTPPMPPSRIVAA